MAIGYEDIYLYKEVAFCIYMEKLVYIHNITRVMITPTHTCIHWQYVQPLYTRVWEGAGRALLSLP